MRAGFFFVFYCFLVLRQARQATWLIVLPPTLHFFNLPTVPRQESLFREHTRRLRRRTEDAFHALVDETAAITLATPWAEARPLLADSARCLAYGRDDRCDRGPPGFLRPSLGC